MFVPEWLDYSFSENAATAMLHGLRGISASWGQLIATAQTTMSIYQDRRNREMVERLYDYNSTYTLPLIAASRILDAASQLLSGIPEEHRLYLALDAAVAFGMYGNFPSAKVVIRRIVDIDLFKTSAIASIMATAAPEFIPQMLSRCETNSPNKYYLELLETFLQTGNITRIDSIRDALIECLLDAPSSFENSLFRSCRLCLEHIFNLSVSKILKEYCPILPDSYINQLIDKNVRVFLPPQFNAIIHYDLPNQEENTLIALPTSTGKTLLGELCLISALKQKSGIVCYLVPYVALGNQVAQTLREHLPKEYKVKRLIGGYQETESLNPNHFMEVLVATPERFDALLRISSHLIPFIRCVVCDEAHNIQNNTRGIRLEGILTRLRLLQTRNYNFRIVLLSAVLSKYDSLKNWMNIADHAVITDTWKPTARRILIWNQEGKLTEYFGDSPFKQVGIQNESKLGDLPLPWVEQGFKSISHLKYPQKSKAIQQQKQKINQNIAYLVSYLRQNSQDPILCVCATKSDTRQVAATLADRFPEIEPLTLTIIKIIARIEAFESPLKPLAEMLKHGIAYHNSTVPHRIRQLIEQAVKNKELIAVTATTTLAEGVDLPFRYTILVDWLTWQGSTFEPMPSLLFKNILGRCGRAGVYTEGETIIFDNPMGDEDYTKSYDYRQEIQKTRFLSEQPDDAELTSAIEDFFETNSAEKKEEIKAVLASQFLAAIPENPDAEYLEDLIAENSFIAYRIGSSNGIKRILTDIRNSLEDNTREALAVSNSPLRLTNFGEQANKTGFSPESCRKIVNFLRKDSPFQRNILEQLGKNNPFYIEQLVKTASQLLINLGQLPEQPISELKKLLDGKRVNKLRVKPKDFELVLSLWLEGESEELIFAELPTVKRSKQKPHIQEWTTGLSELSKWDDDFDKFIDFVTTILKNFLPWLMRACDYLCNVADGWSKEINWQQWSEMLEKGVNSQWAIEAMNKEVPVNRKVVVIVGKELLANMDFSENDLLGLNLIQQNPSFRQQIERIFLNLAEQYDESEAWKNEIINCYKWLWEQANLPIRDIFSHL